MSTEDATTYKCDVCGAETLSVGHNIPEAWSEITIERGGPRGYEATIRHACAKGSPSCFRKLLIDITNADQKGALFP